MKREEHIYVLVEYSLDGEIDSVFGPFKTRKDAKDSIDALDEEFHRQYPQMHGGFVVREMEPMRS